MRVAKVVDQQPVEGQAPVVARPRDRHSALGLAGDDVVAMYRTAFTARAIDERMWNLNRMGKARFVISGQGQEAAQVGSAWTMRAGHDLALPYYRDFGVVLTLGMTALEVFLAVMARPDDPNSGGRQMPNHWGCSRLGIITGSSPIGTQFPHAAGLALASTINDDDKVTVCWFGEAAASKGDFHEGLNFAGIHGLPVVFVCENNQYAISVPMSAQSAVGDVAARADSYGMPGVVVDGNDVLDVYAATSQAVDRARRGGGPSIVECKTYRLLPHTSDDDDTRYRSTEEVDAWRQKDPIPALRRYVLDQELLSLESVEEIETTVREDVRHAARQAIGAPGPDPKSAFTRVYARPIHPIRNAPPLTEQTSPGQTSPAHTSPRPTGPDASTPNGSTPNGSGPVQGPERSVLDAVRLTLHDLLATDERVVVLGEDVGLLGGVFRATEGLRAKFGERRVIDMPLAESSIVGVGIGLALAGLRPIVEIQFADFIHGAFDQLVSEAAKIHYRSNGDFSVPLVVRTPWGGGGHRGPYHSQSVEAFFAHVAGLKVVAPSTPADVAGLLRDAVDDPDPVIFLEHKKTYRRTTGPVPEGDWRVPIGLADVVRPGDDMTIVTYGLHRHFCVDAAAALAADGYSVEVIDLRTISPLDVDTILASVTRTGRLLVVHEDNISFGVGAEVAAIAAEEAFYDLDAPVRRLAMADVPAMPYEVTLEAALMIDTAAIIAAARSLLDE